VINALSFQSDIINSRHLLAFACCYISGAVDAQLIRQLCQDQAIVFVNIDGHAMDDVVQMKPVFVE
jgi:hypothetical protein